ncbi:MAG: tetratricopeptide repeat protein [Spartobacteria bacterium]|nr:tetratricopeptide repeat protein [Spartobacteria bacterium]
MSRTCNGYVKKWGHVLILPALIVLLLAGIRTASRPDMWMHLANGRWQQENGMPGCATTDPFSYTRADTPWINTTWLYDRLLYRTWASSGITGLTALHAGAILAAFLLLLPVTRKFAGPFATALGLLFSACMLLPHLEIRPHIFSLLFIALFTALLSSKCRGWMLFLLLLPVQIVWANMSVSFLLGPLIIAIFVFQTYRGNDENRAPRMAGPMLLLLAASLAVTLISPYGVRLYTQALAMWNNPGLASAQVWQAPFRHLLPPSIFRHTVAFALVLGAGGMILYKGKLPFAITMLAIAGAMMALYTESRYADFFAVMAFPFFCLSFSTWGDSIKTHLKHVVPFSTPPFRMVGSVIILLLILLMALMIVSNRYYTRHGYTCEFGTGIEYDLFPEAASVLLENDAFPEQAVHSIHDGAFLAWRYPGRKIFVDGRTALYGQSFYSEIANGLMRGSQKHRDELFEQWRPAAIVLNMATPLAETTIIPILNEKKWGLAYFDGTTAIILNREVPANKQLVSREIWDSGLQTLDDAYQTYRERAGGFIKPPLSPRLIGAGNYYLSMGRYRRAAAIYAVLTRANPRLAMAWLNLGICQVQLDQASDGIHSLQRACALQPRNPMCRLWLSRAYAAAGDPTNATTAFETARKLNLSMAEAFGMPNEK